VAAPGTSVVAMPTRSPSLESLLADRKARLVGYQNQAYAERYERLVREVARQEASRVGGDRLAREVAVSLYKLMAYKDEYEVARLYVGTDFLERVAAQFEGPYTLQFHLAPPLLARRDADGHLRKRAYGPWMLTAYRWLARARGLRGTPFDPFGHTAERRAEREAITAFEQLALRLAREVDEERLSLALELARLPQAVRGYGHVKEHAQAAAQAKQQRLLAAFAKPSPTDAPVARVAA
jgi:indolepyruvate ferredoxin oxidoreductase